VTKKAHSNVTLNESVSEAQAQIRCEVNNQVTLREKKYTLDVRLEEEIKEASEREKNLKSMIWKNVISSQKIDLVSQAEAKSR
jgi:hypothetical protein